jgi:hypothetical protein
MLRPAAQAVLNELNEIVGADGAALVLRDATDSTVVLDLDLTGANCVECVLPHDLLVDIVRTRLTESDPDIRNVELRDPRD